MCVKTCAPVLSGIWYFVLYCIIRKNQLQPDQLVLGFDTHCAPCFVDIKSMLSIINNFNESYMGLLMVMIMSEMKTLMTVLINHCNLQSRHEVTVHVPVYTTVLVAVAIDVYALKNIDPYMYIKKQKQQQNLIQNLSL